jgi:Bacterial regulatory proteins, luxR family
VQCSPHEPVIKPRRIRGAGVWHGGRHRRGPDGRHAAGERSYRLGVNAHVVKPVDFHEFANAIEKLGLLWVVMALVVAGLPNKQVASKLGTSETTVKIQRHQVMEKLGTGSLSELVRMADRLTPKS